MGRSSLKQRVADVGTALSIRRDRLTVGATARRHRDDFAGVERYVMFVGYPRSGHSLMGSLLNAHPHIVVAHQLHALRYVRANYSREQLFGQILRGDERFGRKGRLGTLGEYDYSVPNQWQGRFSELRVIGDKRGRTSSTFLREHPEMLDRLRTLVGVPVQIIHQIRNPFDNISTIAKRTDATLERAAFRYFRLCETNLGLRSTTPPEQWLDIRHEELIADAPATLARLCEFVGVEPEPTYIADAASIVYDRPHRSRLEAPWTPELIADVEKRMADFPFLAGYRYDEEPVTNP